MEPGAGRARRSTALSPRPPSAAPAPSPRRQAWGPPGRRRAWSGTPATRRLQAALGPQALAQLRLAKPTPGQQQQQQRPGIQVPQMDGGTGGTPAVVASCATWCSG
ncbi:unnamed protein product [Prorocentrum cordatum]|uniref:Uncharacterized protein n=1 Tax=Prorocentrum cordatum TaxID=2364126 RepID=A0ABN9UGX0_9DINO|nr:unnamed protein product [Polarella glacialis]